MRDYYKNAERDTMLDVPIDSRISIWLDANADIYQASEFRRGYRYTATQWNTTNGILRYDPPLKYWWQIGCNAAARAIVRFLTQAYGASFTSDYVARFEDLRR